MRCVLVLLAGLLLSGGMSPAAAVPVAEPVACPVTIFDQPNAGLPERYVPAQNTAADCERLVPDLRYNVCGMKPLAPDVQRPLADGDGMEYLPGVHGNYEIHHRRAGANCDQNATMKLRMEMATLATLSLAARVDGTWERIDSWRHDYMRVYPGRLSYRFTRPDGQWSVQVNLVAPIATPAYGVLGEVIVDHDGVAPATLELAVLAAVGADTPALPAADAQPGGTFVRLDTPQENSPVKEYGKEPAKLWLHDTDYDVLVGWDETAGTPRVLGKGAVVQRFEMKARHAGATAYLMALIDSPGWDEAAVTAQVRGYFDRNENLPESTRTRMTEEALDTFVRIVTQGADRFAELQPFAGYAYHDSVQAWARGGYRDESVRYDLPDAKVAALAHLTANDLICGLYQPPGLVHDAKYADVWNYIFCYRHVHAASDLALADAAIDYLRLLSCNQLSDGLIHSVRANFVSLAHPTRFDASYIDALHHYYRWTGDLESVRQLWPTCVRALGYIESSLNPDGDDLFRDVLHQWKSDYDNRGPSSSFQTALVWRAYRNMAEFGDRLGHAEDAARFRARAIAIHAALQEQLWSDDWAMLGPRGPLGMLRLHPQSLEMEIPIWTGAVDPYQAEMLADWYLTNHAMWDESGGLWMYDNDWWPAVWSQHVPAPGDYLMVAWALQQTGRHEAGYRALQAVAHGSFRWWTPGFNYVFSPDGRQGGNDPGTVIGAWGRILTEGLFGIEPHVDEGYLVLNPRFPEEWPSARLQQPGLDYQWRRLDDGYELTVRTAPDVRVVWRQPVRQPVRSAGVDGKDVPVVVRPGWRHGLAELTSPPGGGTLVVRTEPRTWRVQAAESTRPGDVWAVQVQGVDACDLEDRFGFFDVVTADEDTWRLRLKRAACGRAAVFLRCRVGNVELVEPVNVATMPPQAVDVQARTVVEPAPAGSRFVPLDLAGAYTDDIQTCFSHRWKLDAYDNIQDHLGYWSMPLFVLSEALPRQIEVAGTPFALGPMGPGAAAEQNDLVMLANAPPYEMATGLRLEVGPRRLHKIYLLSLNSNLPQKCYVPAVQVTVHYADGTREATELTPPINFDSFYQDSGVNTVAYPLPAVPGYFLDQWMAAFNFNLEQHHLTMTDIICDPARTVTAVELRSIATETFMGLAGVTLLEVD